MYGHKKPNLQVYTVKYVINTIVKISSVILIVQDSHQKISFKDMYHNLFKVFLILPILHIFKINDFYLYYPSFFNSTFFYYYQPLFIQNLFILFIYIEVVLIIDKISLKFEFLLQIQTFSQI